MRNTDFFQQIEHGPVPWGERSVYVPVFYYDNMQLNALFMAPMARLKALMPSRRMQPLRITPWHGVISISAMEFRDSDIGPYNEVGISIPFTLDKASPVFTGILRKIPAELYVYIHRLPVTTEIAMALGVEFAAYPKFLADIEFERQGDWVTCRLAEQDDHILTLTGRVLELQKIPRSRSHYFTTRGGRLLRSEGMTSSRMSGQSRSSADVRLELGDHPMAQELKGLGLGRMLGYQYSPNYQVILTPVIESFAGE